MKTPLQGLLEHFSLPSVLQFLSMNEKTGELEITSNPMETRIFFTRGTITFAVSNHENLRLSSILLRKKIIDKNQHLRIEELMTAQGGKFGKIAVEERILTDEILQQYLKIQASEVIYDAFAWQEGAFVYKADVPPPEYAVSIFIDLTNLIMEGARRMDETEYFLQRLPGRNPVFQVVPNPEVQDSIQLSMTEWQILFLINGKRSLQQICSELGEEDLEVLRVVYGLYANNLIAPVQKQEDRITLVETVQEAAEESDQPEDDTARRDTPLLTSSKARISWKDILRVRKAQLEWNRVDGRVVTLPLTEREYTIGRQPSNSICLPDTGISNHHARVVRVPAGYLIEDLGSTNGTFVNGEPCTRRLLDDNDRIAVGGIVLIYSVSLNV